MPPGPAAPPASEGQTFVRDESILSDPDKDGVEGILLVNERPSLQRRWVFAKSRRREQLERQRQE